jgi:hypothetical protein
MSRKPLEVHYWQGPVSIGAQRPCDAMPYGHLHKLKPMTVSVAAMTVNIAFGFLLLLSSRHTPEMVALIQAGDPSGSVAEIHFIHQPHPRAVPVPMSDSSSRTPDVSDANRPKAAPAFAPQRNTDGEIMDSAALKALYRGQLQARLERTRPAQTAVVDTLRGPHCRLMVSQDVDGRIQEFQFLTCTGTPEWRDALLSSIRSAAPLPMPPHAALYSRSLEIEVDDAISVRLISDDETVGDPFHWTAAETSTELENE